MYCTSYRNNQIVRYVVADLSLRRQPDGVVLRDACRFDYDCERRFEYATLGAASSAVFAQDQGLLGPAGTLL